MSIDASSSDPMAARLLELEQRCAALEREVGELKRNATDDAASAASDVEITFRDLAVEWKTTDSASSLVRDLAMHPAYQKIIGMGPAAVPLIIAELEREPDHWFWALEAITGADPVPEHAAGDLNAMAAAWIDWAKTHGLV